MMRKIGYIISFIVLCALFACIQEELPGLGNKKEFVRWYNYQLPSFIELCGCNSSCMYELYTSDSEKMIYWKINHNFREDVIKAGMEKETIRNKVEYYFRKPIYRFNDTKITPNLLGSEPSTLISDDGNTIELFSTNGVYYESVDGINWAEGKKLVMSDGVIPSHFSVNKIDGIYYMVGLVKRENMNYMDLYVSTDKIHFDYRGHIISENIDIGNGTKYDNFGNSYLLKTMEGVYFLYYEGANRQSNWEISLMTCDNIFADKGNGFIGNWMQCFENPILPYSKYNYAGETPQLYCNPEIVKGEDNQPLVVDGLYYMYYLTGFYKGNVLYATINRMCSPDLVHWEEEGSMFDVRDVPTGGEERGDNGDQSLCQFKGKSYLFYTLNMNSYGCGVPNIRYTVDDRPLEELMALKP